MAEIRDLKVAMCSLESTDENVTYAYENATFATTSVEDEYILHIETVAKPAAPQIEEALKEAEEQGFEYLCIYLEEVCKATDKAEFEVSFFMQGGDNTDGCDNTKIVVYVPSGSNEEQIGKAAIGKFARQGETWLESEITNIRRVE